MQRPLFGFDLHCGRRRPLKPAIVEIVLNKRDRTDPLLRSRSCCRSRGIEPAGGWMARIPSR